MVKCEICEKEYKSLKALSSHIRVHNITSYEYYEKYLKKENDGICLNYGKIEICEKETNWVNIVVGYHRYCSEKCMVKSDFFRKISSESKLGDKHWLKKSGGQHPNKNKTYEEIHGTDKTLELKNRLSFLGKQLIGTKNPFFNHTHTEEQREIFRHNKLGKTYEEMYGKEKAEQIRLSQSLKLKFNEIYEPYDVKFKDKIYRRAIFNEQNSKCAICNKELIKRDKALHHIDYVKGNSSRDNLIYLCSSCHGKTNIRSNEKRKEWAMLLKEINIKYYSNIEL